MTLPPPKICKRIRQLFRMMASSNANEAASAQDKLKKLLAKHALSWNDIPTYRCRCRRRRRHQARRFHERRDRCAD